MGWTAREIPPQNGRIAVVTGANSGLGYATALELARHGAHVVLACRDMVRGEAARKLLLSEVPEAETETRRLDLADLVSVHAFVERLPHDRVDLLVNNAGVMAVPYARTVDGFETQFGVNHLGHFALTLLLWEHLLAAPRARVVTVSSMLHAMSTIDPHDLNSEHSYHRWIAYARSKTANLLFTHELTRRTEGLTLTATAAHPGYAATELQTRGPRLAGRHLSERAQRLSSQLIAATPELGATPTLYAATAPGAGPDSFTGPRWGVRGHPAPAWRAPWSRHDTAARLLWDASAQLTGMRSPL